MNGPSGEALRVLLVCASEDEGGAARSTYLLARDFRPDRIHPIVVVHRESPLTERLRALGTAVEILPELCETPTRPRQGRGAVGSLLQNLSDIPRAAKRLRALAEDRSADLLYSQGTWANIICALASGRRWPVVWHIRNDHSSRAVRATLIGLARASGVDAVIAVSRAAAKPYGALRDRLHVVHNGVDLEAVDAARRAPVLRARYGEALSPESILVGFAGRIVAHKGPALFAEAACLARARAPELPLRFVVIGSAPRHEGRAGEAAFAAALPEDTLFTGYVREPERYLADLDICVVPSLYRDPFPRVVIEALALGIPVVASNIGGIPEAIEEGQSGFLVPPGSAEALCERILWLGRDRALRRRMAQSAARIARERFTSQKAALAIEMLLFRYGIVRSARAPGSGAPRYTM